MTARARKLGRVTILALAVGVALGTIGCGPRAGRYNVTVSLAPSLRGSSLDVDLVGVGEANLADWSGKDLREYFSGNDAFRTSQQDMRYTMEFNPSSAGAKTLARQDPIWKTWQNVGYDSLYILADVPGTPQRLVLPMFTDRWSGSTIKVEVREGSIVPLTPMKPSK